MFDNLSIREKLVVLLGLSAAIALFISSVITLYSTFVSQKEESLRVLRQMADVTSENMRAALAFQDADSARKMLAPLRADPHIMLALVDGEEGKPMGSYHAANLSASDAGRYEQDLRNSVRTNLAALFEQRTVVQEVTRDRMYVITPILFEEKPIGVLAIVSDTVAVRDRIVRFVVFQLLVSIVTLAILFVVSIRLQKLFTKPIFDLIDTVNRVAATRNYVDHIESRRKDEFNDLYIDFNTMLAEIRDRDEKLSKLAITDVLTGLANRRYAMEEMQAMTVRASRKSEPLGVIVLDVDFFKAVNDTYGHPAGDRVLKAIAKLLLGSARKYDLVARIGGEEFLVLCDGSGATETAAVAERIRESVEKCDFELGDERHLGVTVSIGAYSAVPDQNGAEFLIKTADDALYRAKTGGRNRVEMGAIG
jgi:diguanylate cyclase (GGDEF)-like protein